ncbi:MAG: TetR/AcrR family transcriptional regulator [Lentilitoribacter sp.]
MIKQTQKRSIETRAKLIRVATEAIAANGHSALRVEEVVKNAGVAKGTFFAHFKDKDALMELIIGAQINEYLDAAEAMTAPDDVDELITRMRPLMNFMTGERYIFDVIVRHSGAAVKEEIGPIAQTFDRTIEIVSAWIAQGQFRKDVSEVLLAEGVQAFAVQAMALHFCAINNQEEMHLRFKTYLQAWLTPTPTK